jgi:hypothetical protein
MGEMVEAVTRDLGLALGATKVSFLIADLSGRALVRLAHADLHTVEGGDNSSRLAPDERRVDEESPPSCRSTVDRRSRRCAARRSKS